MVAMVGGKFGQTKDLDVHDTECCHGQVVGITLDTENGSK
jgi:hypothetical protein